MGSSVSNFAEDTKESINKGIKKATPYALPIATLQAATGSMLGGKGGRDAVSDARIAVTNPNEYLSDPRNIKGQVILGAALAGGAAGAGLGTAGGAAGGFAIPSIQAAGAVGGAAIGAGAGRLAGNAVERTITPDMPALPDTGGIAIESSGPVAADLSALARQRQRRGRAGTILTSGLTLGGTPGGKTLLGS